MAEYPPVCRVCLAINVSLLPIIDTPLQFVYERMTSGFLVTTDMKPLTVCYMCYALLRKSYKLLVTSLAAENLLNEIVKRNSKITKRSVSLVDRKAINLTSSMVISTPECIDSTPRTSATTNPINPAQHQPPPGGAPGNASPTPGPAVEKKIKEEPDIKTEYVFFEMETASPSPPAMDDDIVMETLSENESETQQQSPIPIELSWGEPGISAEQPEQETLAAEDPSSSQQTLRLSKPRLPGEKTYDCEVCHRQFKYKNVYENHLRTHTGEKPFSCHICERKFSVSTNLKNHLITHTSEKPYKCVQCDSQYRRLDHLKRHMETHAGEKPFQCIVCNRRFSRKYHLMRHSSVHTDEKLFECNVCQWRFNNNHNLQIHLRTHTGEKLYSCDVCKREFKVKDTLRNHLMANNGYEVFKCKKCKRDFHYTTRKGQPKKCKNCCLKRKRKLKKNE